MGARRPGLLRKEKMNNFSHPGAARSSSDERCVLLDLRPGVGHGCRGTALLEKCNIVLRVADAEDVLRLQPQFAESGAESAAFVHALRHGHERFTIADHVPVQLQFHDGFSHRGFMGVLSSDDASADGQRFHAQPVKPGKETRWRRSAKQFFFRRLGAVQHSPVFGDDVVKHFPMGKDPAQVLQQPAGNQNKSAAGCAPALQSIQCVKVSPGTARERLVVIGGDGKKRQMQLSLLNWMHENGPPSKPMDR